MRKLTWSEIQVTGGSANIKVPAPASILDSYEDVAVLAFPTPKAEMPSLPLPKVTASDPGFNTAVALEKPALSPGGLNWDSGIPRTVKTSLQTKDIKEGLGGLEKTKEALDYFESKVKAAGFPGLHLQGILWGEFPASMSQVPGDKEATQNATIDALGFDSLTNYQYAHLASPNTDYDTWAGTATKDWDTNPRRAERSDCVSNTSPAAFKKYLLKAKAYADTHPKQPKLITINAWNEWAEGSYLEPDTEHGMGYLEAIRDVYLSK
jgi:hypothetical protein